MNQFVEHCSFIRHAGQYIVHSQTFPGTDWSAAYTEGGAAGGRTGVAHASYDFDHWPNVWAWAFALPEPPDPALRGANHRYDQVHLGVGAASLGNVCVGVYGLCQGNGILNIGDETRIYYGRWRNAGERAEDIAAYYHGEVALATLPRDRWGALGLNPGANDGVVCSAPMTLPAPDCELRVNADGAAGLKVDLLDEQWRPIPGFVGGETRLPGGLDCPIRWPGRALAGLAA